MKSNVLEKKIMGNRLEHDVTDCDQKRQNNTVIENHMKIEFDAKSENEGLARIAVASFLTPVDPTVEELYEIKTAVSEAVTNSIIHGYNEGPGNIIMECRIKAKKYKAENSTYGLDSVLHISIEDFGIGISDIDKAREPLYTTKPELERSGMGFMFMEMFMDSVDIKSTPGQGTCIRMKKSLKRQV